MIYFAAALAACGVFIAAGWRSKQTLGLASSRGGYGLPNDPLWGETEVELSETKADAGAAIRLALKRMAPLLSRQSVQAEIAAPLGLLVRLRGPALADLMEEMLTVTLHDAPASRILLTAAPRGDSVHIAITDDMPGANLDVRRAGVRSLMERVAMRGGSLDVDVRPAEGTTLTLRLAAVASERRDRTLPEPIAGASYHLIPSISSDTSR